MLSNCANIPALVLDSRRGFLLHRCPNNTLFYSCCLQNHVPLSGCDKLYWHTVRLDLNAQSILLSDVLTISPWLMRHTLSLPSFLNSYSSPPLCVNINQSLPLNTTNLLMFTHTPAFFINWADFLRLSEFNTFLMRRSP